MFHHDLWHTGLSQYDTSTNPGLDKWWFPTSGGMSISPAIGADGTIYFGCGAALCAVNPDGTQKWQFATGGGVSSSPAIDADGTIYVGCGDSHLYALTDGGQDTVTEKWAFNTGSSVSSSPAIGADGTIYVGSHGYLIALNPDGTLRWALSLGYVALPSSPAVARDGTIYVGSEEGSCQAGTAHSHLFAVNPNGTVRWGFPTNGWVYSSPAIGADGTICVGSSYNCHPVNNGNLYAINPSGREKWAFSTGTGISVSSSPAIGADGTIYFGADDGNFYALTDGGQGTVTEKWALKTGFYGDSSPAIGADGTIYFGSDQLYALTDGGQGTVTEKWAFKTGSWIYSYSPAIGADGTIYVGAGDGNLYALGACPCAPPPPTSISIPPSLAFPNTIAGHTVTETLTVQNTGNELLFISSLTSSDPAEFAVTANTCPAGGLASGLTCTISIGFTPNALGARSATLTLNDNTATSPQSVALSGTGTITMTVSPASFSIGDLKDGTKVVRTVTVTNKQTNPVSLTLPPSFSGTNAGDFTITGGTCTSTLAAKTACKLIVTFAPTAVGTESAIMTVTDSPDPLGPYTVSFTAASTIPDSLSPKTLSFAKVVQTASKTLSVTLTNNATTGSITLTGASIGGANAGDFAVTGGSCGGSLAAASSCTYAVTFTPSTENAESGTLSIAVAEDPNGGPPAVGLSGTGATPLKVAPAAVAFPTLKGGKTSLPKTVTVTNNGSATLTISESVGGANAGDFAVTGGTCGATLAGGGASCTYTLTFTPSIVGAETATLGVSASGDAASPHNVSLGGTGS